LFAKPRVKARGKPKRIRFGRAKADFSRHNTLLRNDKLF
jgi:hypothetical protein